MDEALLQAYRTTDYLVCIDEIEWACIRIDQVLPEPLQALVGPRCWGFITAWNPRGERRATADNLLAQRELLTTLRTWPEAAIYSAIGVGCSGWSEPSLFVIGPNIPTLDALANRHEQNAYVHGHGRATASLRLLRP
ncbi:MAG: DUF3293 domain-containing protein [Rhodanobacter sp.]